MKIKISVFVICKNEEEKIGRCLKAVEWADEIVVLDSGSSDGTLEIVKNFTDKIFVNADWKGFGYQKRLAERVL